MKVLIYEWSIINKRVTYSFIRMIDFSLSMDEIRKYLVFQIFLALYDSFLRTTTVANTVPMQHLYE